MRNFKKILSVCLVLVLLVGTLSITAFADGGDPTPPPPVNYTVNIYLERIIRDSNNLVTNHYSLYSGSPLTVTVTNGASLKDAINQACVVYSSVLDDVVWTSNGEYLVSMEVNGNDYTNHDTYKYNTPTYGQTTYEGSSWMYFYGTPSSIPTTTYTYPSTSLMNATVTGNTTITLSFEDLIYIW